MARIVVVKPLFPLPPSQGTRRVSLALLADLAAAHEVVYLCQLDHRAERSRVVEIERLGVRVVAPLMPNHISWPHKVAYKAKNRIASRLTGVPELSLYWSNRALRSNLVRLQREFQPDLTILEGWEMWPLRRSITRGRAALLAHDAAFRMLERAVAAAGDPAEQARRQARLVRLKKLEIRSWRLYDGILTLTEDDRLTVAESLGLPPDSDGPELPVLRHLPVPVADEFFCFPRPARPGMRVGFLGTFGSDFNRDALDYLLAGIWPRVLARVPEASLRIAGDDPTGRLRQRAERAGAEWLGFVADLGGYYGELDLLVVPLRFGGGVRIRMLEALAAGVPVVATPVAAAGLACRAGEHYLAGADAPALAEQIVALLAEPEMARALGERGQTWCSAHHGSAALRPARLAAVGALLTAAPAPLPSTGAVRP